MIKDADRIQICVEKYGLSREEATRIVKTDNCLLSIEELRLKYDYPEMGKSYPDWLTPTDHYKMCCATVRQMYNKNFANICTPEDMATILYIKTSIKLNTLKNYKHLKAALVSNAMSIYRDGSRRLKYWNKNTLDTLIGDTDISLYDTITADNTEQEERECLNAVLSIKNREVRELLIIIGFIIGNIYSFESSFIDVVTNSEYVKKDKLLDLMEKAVENDKIIAERKYNKETKVRKHSITLANVLKAYKTDLDTSSVKQEIGEYLRTIGFLPV